MSQSAQKCSATGNDQSVKKIYLDYCEENALIPNIDILDVIDKKSPICRLKKSEQSNQKALDKNDLFGISLVVSQNISNLKELEISNHVFTIDRISIIMQGLMDNHNLEKLSFPNNMIDDQGATIIAQWISRNQILKELDVSYNKIRDVGAQSLAEQLKSNDRLKYFSISRNFIETDFFGEMLKINTTLVGIELAHNNYNMESMESIMKALIENKNLKKIRLSGMPVGQIHIHQFCEVLEKNCTLEEIEWDFSISKDDSEIIEKLENALLVNTTFLYLNSNKFVLSMQNEITQNICKLIRANEWIAKNYTALSKQENPICPDYLKEYVIKKIDLIQFQIQQDSYEQQQQQLFQQVILSSASPLVKANNNDHILEVNQYNIPIFQATASTIPDNNNKSYPTFQTLQTNEDQRESIQVASQCQQQLNLSQQYQNSHLNLFYSLPGSRRSSDITQLQVSKNDMTQRARTPRYRDEEEECDDHSLQQFQEQNCVNTYGINFEKDIEHNLESIVKAMEGQNDQLIQLDNRLNKFENEVLNQISYLNLKIQQIDQTVGIQEKQNELYSYLHQSKPSIVEDYQEKKKLIYDGEYDENNQIQENIASEKKISNISELEQFVHENYDILYDYMKQYQQKQKQEQLLHEKNYNYHNYYTEQIGNSQNKGLKQGSDILQEQNYIENYLRQKLDQMFQQKAKLFEKSIIKQRLIQNNILDISNKLDNIEKKVQRQQNSSISDFSRCQQEIKQMQSEHSLRISGNQKENNTQFWTKQDDQDLVTKHLNLEINDKDTPLKLLDLNEMPKAQTTKNLLNIDNQKEEISKIQKVREKVNDKFLKYKQSKIELQNSKSKGLIQSVYLKKSAPASNLKSSSKRTPRHSSSKNKNPIEQLSKSSYRKTWQKSLNPSLELKKELKRRGFKIE